MLVEPRKLVILEGIMIYFDKRIRDLVDLKLYVDTPDDIRFIRRLRRDITERGRTVDSVIEQYTERVRPGHYEFVEPTKAYADLVIPEGGFNVRAMEALTPFLKPDRRLSARLDRRIRLTQTDPARLRRRSDHPTRMEKSVLWPN